MDNLPGWAIYLIGYIFSIVVGHFLIRLFSINARSVIEKDKNNQPFTWTAGMVGILERILGMTVDYVKERIRFNRPLGSFQAVQQECAKVKTCVDGTRLSTYQAAWRLSEGLPCTREAAIAKAWMNQTAEYTIATGHQFHGAMGLMEEHDLQLFTRRAKAAQSAFGGSDFYREIVAQEMGL